MAVAEYDEDGFNLQIFVNDYPGGRYTKDYNVGDYDIRDYDIGDYNIGDYDTGDYTGGYERYDIGDYAGEDYPCLYFHQHPFRAMTWLIALANLRNVYNIDSIYLDGRLRIPCYNKCEECRKAAGFFNSDGIWHEPQDPIKSIDQVPTSELSRKISKCEKFPLLLNLDTSDIQSEYIRSINNDINYIKNKALLLIFKNRWIRTPTLGK
ncbi:hypothetical protein GE21DRAFT_1276409 [Neurospora crassa]|nr:hypothetical protein GE21DRAFT_1276409 [Neurospora crassa]